MEIQPELYTRTAMAQGLRDLFQRLEQQLGLNRPLAGYIGNQTMVLGNLREVVALVLAKQPRRTGIARRNE